MLHLSEDQLEQFIRGKLSPVASDEILKHLLICEDCRKLCTELEDYQQVLRESIDPGPKYDLAVICRRPGYSEEASAISKLMQERRYSVWPLGDQTWEDGVTSDTEWIDVLRQAMRAAGHIVILDKGVRNVTWQDAVLGPRAQRLISLHHNTTLLYFGTSTASHPYRSLNEAMNLIEDAVLRPDDAELPRQHEDTPEPNGKSYSAAKGH